LSLGLKATRQFAVTDLPDMISLVEEITGLLSMQLFNPHLCDRVINYAEKSNDWSAASIGEENQGTYDSAVRPQYRSAVTFSPSEKSLVHRELVKGIDRYVRPQLNRTWHVDRMRYADTHIVRYVTGGFYVSHADAGLDRNDRYFTVLCYLNDDYRGGYTSFPTMNFSVVPQRGKAIVFPSTYIHRAEPVLEGTKYIMVSWLVGSDPPQWI
jgi:Uncharacterized iron-regulated protein